jgi:hypothetical protein
MAIIRFPQWRDDWQEFAEQGWQITEHKELACMDHSPSCKQTRTALDFKKSRVTILPLPIKLRVGKSINVLYSYETFLHVFDAGKQKGNITFASAIGLQRHEWKGEKIRRSLRKAKFRANTSRTASSYLR